MLLCSIMYFRVSNVLLLVYCYSWSFHYCWVISWTCWLSLPWEFLLTKLHCFTSQLLVCFTLTLIPNKKICVFFFKEWALGLLHMKCTCGIIWLTDTSFKRTLDVMYQNGARNLNLSFVIKEIVSPVVCNLVLALAIPYITLMGIIKYLGM